ncbi:N-formylglutamate deformylase [Sulfitobacter aestuariivivens]|uniref:N-formylglutamate deformylase n=1 Tax=Sulfitobacter aestuariivivens TaxID=2766981 RepID=A0A927HES9_9RHOB|nr:N-formylglutamate deformylase [Sulfitobacter aestuariivivens]
MIEVTQGNSPIVLGLPHTGTDIPSDVSACLNDTGRAMADTDWHIHQLYSDLGLDLTRVRTPIHRYVIDVNRAPDDVSLYPGLNTTGLCPLTDFDGDAIYHDGKEPDDREIARRKALYHQPYHAALAAELERVRDKYGVAILYDCHSIRSVIPYLFDDTLPDFNIGTNSSRSCAASVEKSVHTRCRAATSYSCVLNGRFKGGFTTRHYGRPEENIHAIQMELAQSTYLDETPPWIYREDKAARLRPILYRILNDLSELIYERQLR